MIAAEMKAVKEERFGIVQAAVYKTYTADHAELALTRLRHSSPEALAPERPPVIMLHGSYSKRNFWVSPKGVGLGSYLNENGFDIWIPELRGHGLSPKDDQFATVTAEDQIKFDLPAIQEAVCAQTGQDVFWIAHSFGGVFLLAALSAGWLNHQLIRGMVTFGSQISKGEGYLKIPMVAPLLNFVLQRKGVFPAPRFGLGPEVESAATMTEIINWKRLGGKWVNSEGFCYWDGMSRLQAPLLAFAGAADRNDPPEGCQTMFSAIGSPDKELVILGKKQGFSKNFDHVGMVVSKAATDEVWPLVAEWLQKKRQAARGPYRITADLQ